MLTSKEFEEYLELEEAVMTNFDHSINIIAAENIKQPKTYGHYSAWNFHGLLYWKDDTYHCDIWVDKVYRKTITGTLQEIMETASKEYGSE